jgi:hypothetical protein
MTKYYAPWTDAQIDCLQVRQNHPLFHPYTCGNNSNHRDLVPTRDGWICLDCDYKQDWFLIDELGFFANTK